MVKMTFISLVEETYAPGLRALSAHVRAEGHETRLVFLPWGFTDPALNSGNSFRYPYPRPVLDQVAELCRDADLVGLSLMTCHLDNAVRLTRYLRGRVQAPVIWGGIHPTIRPSECLEHADLVCVGEGERSVAGLLRELQDGRRWQDVEVPGIGVRHHATAAVGVGPIVEDLGSLPLPDYGLEHQFILHEGVLKPMEGALLSACFGRSYQAMFSRGCPYACAYCCNEALRRLHGRPMPVRWRPVEDRLRELEAAVRLMPDLQTVSFADDAFLSQPEALLRDFVEQYRRRINLPFFMLATPRSVTREKIALLLDSGLFHIGIGLQSGSERVMRKVFRRPERPDTVVEAALQMRAAARERRKALLTRYDVILDNPWDEEPDLMATVRLCQRLPTPYNLALFSLTLYPGTHLYDQAKAEGRITDELRQIYRASQLVPRRTYLNGVFAALSANAPSWAVAALMWAPLRRRGGLAALPYGVAFAFHGLKLAKGLLQFVRRGEWAVIRSLLKAGWWKLVDDLGVHGDRARRPRFEGGLGDVPGESAAS